MSDPLLQPFDLKGLHLRNRVVSTSHEPAYAEDGLPKERYRAYHVEKARGGVALTMIGGSAVVSPDSPPAFGNLLLYRDEIVPWLSALADEVHEAGAAVMTQVTHLGRRTSNYTGDWLPVLAPSPLREPSHRAFPKEAEPWDLDRIVADYVAAAQRCEAAGLDGLEFEAYGHLLDGFLSPKTNQRTDEYGGSARKRLAFPRRVVQAVRAAVGDAFVLGIRLTVDEAQPGGLGFDDGIAALQTLTGDGIDFVSTIRGHIETDAALVQVIPTMGMPSAPHLEFSAQVKRHLDIPVMHAGRIADVATARHAIAEGLLDLVGMTRAQMADPHLVAKVAARQEDRIRPCVGATYCLDAIYDSGDAKCIHNPATGREVTLPHILTRGSTRRRAVVVGAGPAGLEAARVLGERGHDVTLLEASDKVGGQLRLAATLGRRRDLIGIADWRLAEAKRAGVDVRLNTYAEGRDVLALEPDLVIVATGGSPNVEFVGGASALVTDTWDVLSRSVRLRGRVLVYDDNGSFPALDAVEFLGGTVDSLEYVTPERTIAPEVGGMNIPAYLRAFAQHQVATTLGQWLRRVEPAEGGGLAVTLYSEFADQESSRIVDAVVVEHGTLPNDELYRELLPSSRNLGEVDHDALLGMRPQEVVRNESGTFSLFRIGDAVTSRNVHAAILDALRLCAPL